MKHYDSKFCKTMEEFNNDLNKILYIKKLLTRIQSGEDINIRLVLNHIIIFYNVFEPEAATNMLFFKIDQDKWGILKTFLHYLNFAPQYVSSVNIILDEISLNKKILQELEKL